MWCAGYIHWLSQWCKSLLTCTRLCWRLQLHNRQLSSSLYVVCRVHTLAFPVVQELADMYKAVDAPATVNLLAKLAVEKSYHAKLDDTRSSLAVSLAACNALDVPCCLLQNLCCEEFFYAMFYCAMSRTDMCVTKMFQVLL